MNKIEPLIFDDKCETSEVELKTELSIPAWLNGDLVRNGPGLFTFNQLKLNHWFDGMAVLHKFSFENGKVKYFSKFLQSEAYLSLKNNNTVETDEFATTPKQSIFKHVINLLKGTITDNNNVNIIKFGDYYLVMTETDNHMLLDKKSLSIAGKLKYKDGIKLVINLAHPIVESGYFFNIGANFGKVSFYYLYKTHIKSNKREIIAKIPTKSSAYMHSFAMTENYFILYENPLRLSLFKLFFSGKPFIENYVWRDIPVEFTILDKNGNIVLKIKSENFFCFHMVNAYEENGKVYLDLIIYPDASIIQALYLNSKIDAKSISSRLFRYIFDIDEKKCEIVDLNIANIEFSVINPNYAKKAYNILYAVAGNVVGLQLNTLVKIELNTNKIVNSWFIEGCYPGEPVFVPNPENKSEDCGVIISIIGDIVNNTSFLLILDAASFTEISRIRLPHLLPMGLHGSYYNN